MWSEYITLYFLREGCPIMKPEGLSLQCNNTQTSLGLIRSRLHKLDLVKLRKPQINIWFLNTFQLYFLILLKIALHIFVLIHWPGSVMWFPNFTFACQAIFQEAEFEQRLSDIYVLLSLLRRSNKWGFAVDITPAVIRRCIKVKGKTIPLQALTDPEGSRTIGTWSW